jgi:hypothetical protein
MGRHSTGQFVEGGRERREFGGADGHATIMAPLGAPTTCRHHRLLIAGGRRVEVR